MTPGPQHEPKGRGGSPSPDKTASAKHRRWYLRNWVQWAMFAVTVAIGIQFAIFVHQAESMGPITVQRPPGVEGFLPIGALMGWKLFFSKGLGLTIILVFVLSIYTARITGHWQSRLHPREFQHLLKQIDSPHMIHPSVGQK